MPNQENIILIQLPERQNTSKTHTSKGKDKHNPYDFIKSNNARTAIAQMRSVTSISQTNANIQTRQPREER